MKYLSKFGPPLAYYIGASKKVHGETASPSYWWYFLAQVFQMTFSLYWDFRWDWGMFIGTKPGRKFLRNEIKFSPRFYYCAMIENTVFRLWWLIGAFTITYSDSAEWVEYLGVLSFISGLVELIRRTVWGILRVENEFYNNFEQYRDIIIIPPINEEPKME